VIRAVELGTGAVIGAVKLGTGAVIGAMGLGNGVGGTRLEFGGAWCQGHCIAQRKLLEWWAWGVLG